MGDKPRLTREQIALRAAQELTDGACVNLGWGIPNLIADYLPKNVTVYFHSENGILGMGPIAEPGREDPDLINAGKQYVTLLPGASVFDHPTSFSMIRGGHIDYAHLGLTDLIATQLGQYTHIATSFASDKIRLVELRSLVEDASDGHAGQVTDVAVIVAAGVEGQDITLLPSLSGRCAIEV